MPYAPRPSGTSEWPVTKVEVLHAFQTMNIDEVIYVGQGLVVRISRDRNDVEFGAGGKVASAPDAIGPPGSGQSVQPR